MKKLFLIMCLLSFSAQAADGVRQLPSPTLATEVTFVQAVKDRKTIRSFSPDKKLSDQTLSDVLFVAWGMTRDGKRTVPTARNLQHMRVFVVEKDASWHYDAKQNALLPVPPLYKYIGAKGAFADAPVHLLYVSTVDDDRYASFHAGSMAQNVSLYAAAVGLSQTIRGAGLDRTGIQKVLKLDDDDQVIAAHALGYPAEE